MSPKGKSSNLRKSSGSPEKKNIEQAIANRPTKDEIADKGILKGGHVSAGIASATNELGKNQVKTVINSHLKNRTPKEDLISQNILLSDPTSKNAPSGAIQQAAAELKKKQTADTLNKKLATRHSEEDLLEKNILKAPINVAPGLVAKQQELNKSKINDAVNQQVKKQATKLASEQAEPTLKKRDSKAMLEHVTPAQSTKKSKSSHAL